MKQLYSTTKLHGSSEPISCYHMTNYKALWDEFSALSAVYKKCTVIVSACSDNNESRCSNNPLPIPDWPSQPSLYKLFSNVSVPSLNAAKRKNWLSIYNRAIQEASSLSTPMEPVLRTPPRMTRPRLPNAPRRTRPERSSVLSDAALPLSSQRTLFAADISEEEQSMARRLILAMSQLSPPWRRLVVKNNNNK